MTFPLKIETLNTDGQPEISMASGTGNSNEKSRAFDLRELKKKSCLHAIGNDPQPDMVKCTSRPEIHIYLSGNVNIASKFQQQIHCY